MKDKLYNYTIATLDLLAPELTVEEKEALVIKIVSENFAKCAAGYLKESKDKLKLDEVFNKPFTKKEVDPFKVVTPTARQPFTLPKGVENPCTVTWSASDYVNSLENYQAS